MYAVVMKESDATFSPTCFMNVKDRTPLAAEAAATYKATFSFAEYSKYTPEAFATALNTSPISDDGVPG